jgi:hypothetical protein
VPVAVVALSLHEDEDSTQEDEKDDKLHRGLVARCGRYETLNRLRAV